MARGVSSVGGTEEEARQSILRDHPELKIVACEPIDLSDISLRTPISQHWAVSIEDSDPTKFVQDADPIGKITNEVRHTYSMIVADPQSLSSGVIEGPFTCPGCASEVNLEMPPPRITSRMPRGQKVYSRCPDCNAKLYRPRGAPPKSWQLERAESSPQPRESFPAGAGLGLRRACIFCEAEDRKISKEHLWAKWMRPHVEGSESWGTSGRIIASETGIVQEHERWPSTGFDREISGACKACNQGWMQELETVAAPLLIPMFGNQEIELRPEEQRVLARWATLKVLVAQHSHPPGKQTIPRDRYRLFYADRKLPLGAQIWIARCNGAGAWPTNYQYRDLFITPAGGDEPAKPNAYLLAFSVGYLAFFYWGHELPQGPVADLRQVEAYLSPIWPATGVARWPPPGLLEADGLEFIMNRFPLRGWA